MPEMTVLLADDEAHVTHVMARAVRAAGLGVITAEDGEEAYELASEHRPDLIVTDLQMPYMSGIDLARRLCEHHELSKVPVILLSARGYVVEAEAKTLTNIRAVIEKPFSAREVVSMIRELLGYEPDELRQSA
ncbi:MAG: response regulator [Phycisphaerales bacterium]|nr:response regulator [Planctomycetota bacterium]MCH8507783.1 response regulator [Phycisphaerales bacterium]